MMPQTIIIPVSKSSTPMTVSPEDEWLASYRWCRSKDGYAVTNMPNKGTRLAHRILMERVLGRPLRPEEWCDHINRNILDNRRDNLRIVNPYESIWNRGKTKRPTASRFKGVLYAYPSGKRPWAARIAAHDTRITLGRFTTEEEAAYVYDQFSLALHGNFGVRNFL